MNIKAIFLFSIILNLIFFMVAGYYVKNRGGLTYLQTRASIATASFDKKSLASNPNYIIRKDMFETFPITDTSIVFVGDSITADCQWGELLGQNNIKNRGIGGDTTFGLLNRLDNVVKLNPEKIFLMIGINDLLSGFEIEETVINYDKILENLSTKLPKSKIIIQSVLPVGNYIDLKDKNKIIVLNKEIENLSRKYNLQYIDLYAVMKYQNDLNSDLTRDGVHLNGKGYQVWKDAIKEYI